MGGQRVASVDRETGKQVADEGEEIGPMMNHNLPRLTHTLTLTLSSVLLALLPGLACPAGEAGASADFTVIRSYPHDNQAFTQGLVFHNGYLYESTGLYGRSSLRKVDLSTGAVKQIRTLSSRLFGEGATIFNDKIYQLTWKAGVGIIYAVDSLNIIGSFQYPFEGWGITHDQRHLIISNGTSRLIFYHPESLKPVKEITVTSNNKAVTLLNELEYIDGKIYANIWRSDEIIAIDPDTGIVVDRHDLSALRRQTQGAEAMDVLNGIAFDKHRNRLFVTGKFWPRLFEIQLQ